MLLRRAEARALVDTLIGAQHAVPGGSEHRGALLGAARQLLHVHDVLGRLEVGEVVATEGDDVRLVRVGLRAGR